MEDILEVYHREYNEKLPVVCMDESNKQLVSCTRMFLPVAPGKPLRIDDEYVRHGVADIFLAVEPMASKRWVTVTERRTRIDWANFIKSLLDGQHKEAEKVILVMDNLNTHGIASLYEAFPAEEAWRPASRLEIHFTPKHGSWMNMAEIELSALAGQCLDGRIPDITTMRTEVAAWALQLNNKGSDITWRFTTEEARVKLRRLYQKI
jgi:hypothetical protein